MISERSLAEGFQSHWHDILPMMTPAFMHVFNNSYVNRLEDEDGALIPEIPLLPGLADYGVVAELAFHIAKASFETDQSIPLLLSDADAKKLALESAFRTAGEQAATALDDSGWNEAIELAETYDALLIGESRKSVEFEPRLRGHGFLGGCRADLSVGETLFEIKTVTRNFAGHDLRQLFIYLALDAATGARRWKYGGLFNPRRATFAQFPVEYLLENVSGGLSASEVFDRILSFLSKRDLTVDSAF